MNRYFISAVIVLLLVIYQTNAQSIQAPNNAVQLSDEFDESRGQLTFYADNIDFCDYYLYISFMYSEGFSGMGGGKSVVVGPGKHSIMNYKVIEGASRIGYNYQYAMFRGTTDKKPNVDFSYALPVSNEETVVSRATENRDGYQLSFELPTDTVRACRGGIVCDDDLKDNTAKGFKNFSDNQTFTQITLYHDDGTFGEYIFRGRSLVYSGQRIKMGIPVAIVDKELYHVNFSVYFLDKNKVKDNNIGNKHTHFRPFFQSYNGGKVRLESGKTYISELTDEMFMQDMSKREQKKFLKSKTQQENGER